MQLFFDCTQADLNFEFSFVETNLERDMAFLKVNFKLKGLTNLEFYRVSNLFIESLNFICISS